MPAARTDLIFSSFCVSEIQIELLRAKFYDPFTATSLFYSSAMTRFEHKEVSRYAPTFLSLRISPERKTATFIFYRALNQVFHLIFV